MDEVIRMAPSNPYNAYGPVSQQQVRASAPGHTEAWALIEAARRMAAAIEASLEDEEGGRKQMQEALRLNWRLWTIFQANLVTESVAVPDPIRVNMLTLCKFVDSQTAAAIPAPSPERLAALININRNIASGLLSVDANAAKPAEQPAEAPPPAMASFSAEA
jgi:flagellar biosynthesis activator protein FlaF